MEAKLSKLKTLISQIITLVFINTMQEQAIH